MIPTFGVEITAYANRSKCRDRYATPYEDSINPVKKLFFLYVHTYFENLTLGKGFSLIILAN